LIGPCRGLCQSVRASCEPTINQFGFSWPHGLDCQRFPAANDDQHMCMDGGGTDDEPPADGDRVSPRSGGLRQPVDSRTPTTTKRALFKEGCVSGSVYVNRTSLCLPMCNEDVTYTLDEKQFVQVWMAVWATLCVASTTFALVTSFLKSDRCVRD